MRKKYRDLPTQQTLKELYHYDPETGIFTRAIDRKKWKAGQTCGTKSKDGYINISVNRAIHRAHRLAWVYMTGLQPKLGIDHENGIRDDNRWSNLREASQSENMCNRPSQTNSSTGIKGIYPQGNFSRARVQIGKQLHDLGCFKTKEEAKAAYDTAAKILHGDFFKSG